MNNMYETKLSHEQVCSYICDYATEQVNTNFH